MLDRAKTQSDACRCKTNIFNPTLSSELSCFQLLHWTPINWLLRLFSLEPPSGFTGDLKDKTIQNADRSRHKLASILRMANLNLQVRLGHLQHHHQAPMGFQEAWGMLFVPPTRSILWSSRPWGPTIPQIWLKWLKRIQKYHQMPTPQPRNKYPENPRKQNETNVGRRTSVNHLWTRSPNSSFLRMVE